LTKSGVKVIIRNEIRNKMISPRPFTFSKGKWEYQDQREMLMVGRRIIY